MRLFRSLYPLALNGFHPTAVGAADFQHDVRITFHLLEL